jgi:four helix bundle protein
MATVKTFEDLICWKKATEIRMLLSKVVKKFPSEEKYRLVDQIIRSSRSATANIAEGFGRYHYQEFIQFCRQGRGSLFETIDHLIVASDEAYISTEELIKYKQDINECLAVLNGFINYLEKAKKAKNRVEEPKEYYGQF